MQTPPISQKPALRDWLLSATPASRFQARAGRAYIGWTAFTETRLAMIGLIIILGLLLAAALAPALAPFPPNLTARLAAPMTDGHLLGADELRRVPILSKTWGIAVGFVKKLPPTGLDEARTIRAAI
jgi:peptide/nickel transport system permease protein